MDVITFIYFDMRYIIWLVVIIAIALGLWWMNSSGDENAPANTTDGEELQVETTDLVAVGNYTGSGEATRSFDGQVFTHTVEADLGAPAAGKFYEGWLVITSPLQFFSTGELKLSGGKYALTYTDNEDQVGYPQVVITEETRADGFDNKPEAHVLEGSF